MKSEHRTLKRILGTGLLVAASVVTMASHPSVAFAQDTGDAAKEERLAEARRQFDAGVSLLDDPDGAKYEDAHRAFKRAYELSKSPKVLGNIGFCAMKLERDGEAIDAYTQYLREVPDIEEREKNQIQKDLYTLSSTVGRVQVTVKHAPGKFILIDRRIQTRGEPIENAYPFEGGELTIRLRAGRHTLKVKSGTEESVPYEMTLEPGSIATHEFIFAPNNGSGDGGGGTGPRKSPSVVGPVILGAIGVAGIGTGVVTGLLARGKTSDIEKDCPDNTCPASYDLAGNRTKAKTLGTIADISFISGGVLLGGAIIWYLVLPSGGADQPTKRGSGSSAVSWLTSTGAMCTRDGCGVSIQRGF